MICGGFNNDIFDIYLYSLANECYSFTAKKATLITYMSVERVDAASIVLNDNTLWVTGGSGLAATEYLTATGTMLGPDLPMALYEHAMVAINSTCSIVIGGFSNYEVSTSTFFYNHNEGEWHYFGNWTNGPSLVQGRRYPAAGIVTDEVTDEHFVVVTGGDVADLSGSAFVDLDSTEILQDGEWVQGKIDDMLSSGHFLLPKYF